jgi:hypothetical protein
MVAKIVVVIFLFNLLILCVAWSLNAIIEKDNKFAVLCSIAARLFGVILGMLLGSLLF